MSDWEYDFDVDVRKTKLKFLGNAKFEEIPLPPGEWKYSVSLPHQCDDWMVAEADTKAAVDELQVFIAKAERALDKLMELE